MSKNLEINILLDIYGCLLTKKQFNIMDLYYNEDLSLGEIAQQCEISRQGVFDAVKKCEHIILEYEEKLGIYANQKEYIRQLKEFRQQALDIFEECKKINLSKNIAQKTIVLLENFDNKLEVYDASSYLEQIDGGLE